MATIECILSNRSYIAVKLYYPTLLLSIVGIWNDISTEYVGFIRCCSLCCATIDIPNLVICGLNNRCNKLNTQCRHRLNSIALDNNLFRCRFLKNASLGVCNCDGYTVLKCCLGNNYPKLGCILRRCAKCYTFATIKRNGCCCFAVSHCQLRNFTKGNSCSSRACNLLITVTLNLNALDCCTLCIVQF